MSKLKIFLLFFFIFTLSPVKAYKARIYAGLREYYLKHNDQHYTYDSDGAARVIRGSFLAGFKGVVADARLAMRDQKDSMVYVPPGFYSKPIGFETLSARVAHHRGELILRPTIFSAPSEGLPERLIDLKPQKTAPWFQSYKNRLLDFADIIKNSAFKEMILGVGMGDLWKSQHINSWLDIANKVKMQLGPKSKLTLSIALTNIKERDYFTTWKKDYPAKWESWKSNLSRVWVTIPLPQNQNPLDWDEEELKEIILRELQETWDLFQKPMAIHHLTIPGCKKPTYIEDSTFCQKGDESIRNDLQANGLRHFLNAIKKLPEEWQNRLTIIDLYASGTDSEPEEVNIDFRHVLYNKFVNKVLQEWSPIDEYLSYLDEERFFDPSVPYPFPPTQQKEDLSNKKVACIYYDRFDANDKIGLLHSILLENLVGAFPEWTPKREITQNYQKGDFEKCETVFYLGTNYFIIPSNDFFNDAITFTQKKTLVWMNYKLGEFLNYYANKAQKEGLPPWGFHFERIEGALQKPDPQIADPGFFRYFDYKGVEFFKESYFHPETNNFAANPEMGIIAIDNPQKSEVLSWARHSTQKERKTPYVTLYHPSHEGAFYYIGDSPFSFVHYEDRYLIFTDLMWDFLHTQAPERKPVALLRLEDINPRVNNHHLHWTSDFLAENHIPYSLALIPYYSNLFQDGKDHPHPHYYPITHPKYKEFLSELKYSINRGADIVMHGIAHQAGDLIGGFDGVSANDYEFWLYPENTPLPHDSVDYVLDLLTQAEKVFLDLKVRPIAWETPHYASSALDSYIFGKLFKWTFHRAIYFDSEIIQDAPLQSRHRLMDCLTLECRQERRYLANQLKIKTNGLAFTGQIFPYPVYKDVYGQAIIPETLGMIDYIFYKKGTWRRPSNPDDILRRAKKLKVIRGAIASFFWHHPNLEKDALYYKEVPGHYDAMENGKLTLKKVINGLKELGYEFRSISECSLFPQKGCRK